MKWETRLLQPLGFRKAEILGNSFSSWPRSLLHVSISVSSHKEGPADLRPGSIWSTVTQEGLGWWCDGTNAQGMLQ